MKKINPDETYQELLVVLRPEKLSDYPSVLGKFAAASVLFLRLDALARTGKLPTVWKTKEP